MSLSSAIAEPVSTTDGPCLEAQIDAVPCCLAGIIFPPYSDAISASPEFVVQPCSTRTYVDSTLCEEWHFDPSIFMRVNPQQVLGSVFVIPVNDSTVAVVKPTSEWKLLFT